MKTQDKPVAPIQPMTLDQVCYQVNGLTLLDNISITLPKDQPVTIVGPNGAGKTLLLRICHGLLKPVSGSITWQDPVAANKAGVQAMVFQRPVMLKRSAIDNILFALHACGISASELGERAAVALEKAGLSSLANRPARKLSGGEQQRLALARCIALDPAVLFLDEPTSHLDPASTVLIENLIASISQSGCQTIMVTHDLAQARRLGQFTLFMQGGKLVEAGETEQFFSNPRSEALAGFLQGRAFR